MLKRKLFNYHSLRQAPNMRQCWNKLFFLIIRVLIIINQIILMAPFLYYKSSKNNFIPIASAATSSLSKINFPVRLAVTWKFRTHRLVTAMAILLLIFYAVASPFMGQMMTDLYLNTRRNKDYLFIMIAKFTMAMDVLCTLLIMATHIWHRESIVKILNLINEMLLKFETLEKNFVNFKILMALVLKMVLGCYEIFLDLPYLFSAASRLSTQSIVAFLFTHYLQGMGIVFDLSIFLFILIFLSFSLQLEKELECCHVIINDLKMSQLINLQNMLQELIALFRNTFQFGIFLSILVHFITILCNIYAVLDFYVTTHHLYSTFITYLLSIVLELYSLIFVTYLFDRSQRKVKDSFLQREELYFLKPSKLLSIVETDILWPQLNEFHLLGFFTLNNKFALFLFAYSVNFIVLILEFEVNKAHS